MESPLKLSSPLSPYNLSSPDLLKSLADDNGDFDLSKITTSFVSPTCSVKAASVNNFISSVSLPSVSRSLARVCFMENLFFLTKPDPVKLPLDKSSLSIPSPLNDQYNLVLLGTSFVLILVFKVPPSAIDDLVLIA